MCFLELSGQYCRALQKTYIDYNMDYWERVLSFTWHQAWPLIKKQNLNPSSGLCTSKRNRVKETFLQWAGQHLLWAGIKPGLDGIPWWDPWTSGMRRACSRAREQLIVGPTETSPWEAIGRGQGPEELRERGGWSRLVPPKDAFELGNEGQRKEAGCPGIRHMGKQEECGCMDHWRDGGSSSAVITQASLQMPSRAHASPKHWDLCAFWEKVWTLLCRPFTATGAWAVTMTGSKLCFRKTVPGAGEMGWHCINGWDSSWGPAVGQFSGGLMQGMRWRYFTGDRLWDSGAAGFLAAWWWAEVHDQERASLIPKRGLG